MTKRHTNLLIGTACLLTGGTLYVLFRENTYIAELFSNAPFVKSLSVLLSPIASGLLCFYLPDFLWCLALGCGLQAVFSPSGGGSILCGVGAFLCGVLWECMQSCGVISGTGDLWDIVSYFLAGALCIIFNF